MSFISKNFLHGFTVPYYNVLPVEQYEKSQKYSIRIMSIEFGETNLLQLVKDILKDKGYTSEIYDDNDYNRPYHNNFSGDIEQVYSLPDDYEKTTADIAEIASKEVFGLNTRGHIYMWADGEVKNYKLKFVVTDNANNRFENGVRLDKAGNIIKTECCLYLPWDAKRFFSDMKVNKESFKYFKVGKYEPEDGVYPSIYPDDIKIRNNYTTNMEMMFFRYQGSEFPTEIFEDTTQVQTMKQFCDWSKFIKINISNFSLGNCTSLYYAFAECTELKEITLGNLNTEKVENFEKMFAGPNSYQGMDSNKLTTLDISELKFNSATNIKALFSNCKHIENIKGLENIKTDKIKDMSNMFYMCKNLKEVDINSWNVNNVNKFLNMFAYCNTLSKIDISSWNINSASKIGGMFSYAESLETIYCNSTINDSDTVFGKCYKLVGGKGTKFNSSHISGEYARPDGGENNPGYFTAK